MHLTAVLIILLLFAAVTLDIDAEFPIVGSIVNLTCSVNGTPPLTIEFYRDSLVEAINPDDLIVTQLGGDSAVIQQVVPWEVSETGRSNFTCVVSNSTSELESSIVQVTGVGQSIKHGACTVSLLFSQQQQMCVRC